MEKIKFNSGEVIFNQGDAADKMYKVLSGSVKIIAGTGSDDEEILATLKNGAYFGEMGIIENQPRSASAVAKGTTELLSIDADSFEKFVADNAPDVIDMMRSLSSKVRKTTKDYLDASKTVDKLIAEFDGETRRGMFKSLSDFIKTHIELADAKKIDEFTVEARDSFKAGEIIFKAGQLADVMYKIISGEVSIIVNHGADTEKEVTTLTQGAIFGEMGVVDSERRNSTAVAKTDVRLMSVANGKLELFITSHPSDALRILTNISRNLRKTTADYLELCEKISELVQKNADEDLKTSNFWSSLVQYSDIYNEYRRDIYFSGVYNDFMMR